jgi:hypothetical protein
MYQHYQLRRHHGKLSASRCSGKAGSAMQQQRGRIGSNTLTDGGKNRESNSAPLARILGPPGTSCCKGYLLTSTLADCAPCRILAHLWSIRGPPPPRSPRLDVSPSRTPSGVCNSEMLMGSTSVFEQGSGIYFCERVPSKMYLSGTGEDDDDD